MGTPRPGQVNAGARELKVMIRVTDGEFETLLHAAERASLPVATWARRVLLGIAGSVGRELAGDKR